VTLQNEFKGKKYLNLETFRKSGEGVKTPVWFVMDGNIIYIQTQAHSGKVKRIHNNGIVSIAPCTVDGRVTGEWMNVFARNVNEDTVIKNVDQLLGKKYGLLKKLFYGKASEQKNDITVLEITIQE
jgi:PPOX class probable F420-dependent enzyme